jgi:hypothetical protein
MTWILVANGGSKRILEDYLLVYHASGIYLLTDISEENSDTFSLMMETAYSSETSININFTTEHHIPEDNIFIVTVERTRNPMELYLFGLSDTEPVCYL